MINHIAMSLAYMRNISLCFFKLSMDNVANNVCKDKSSISYLPINQPPNQPTNHPTQPNPTQPNPTQPTNQQPTNIAGIKYQVKHWNWIIA